MTDEQQQTTDKVGMRTQNEKEKQSIDIDQAVDRVFAYARENQCGDVESAKRLLKTELSELGMCQHGEQLPDGSPIVVLAQELLGYAASDRKRFRRRGNVAITAPKVLAVRGGLAPLTKAEMKEMRDFYNPTK